MRLLPLDLTTERAPSSCPPCPARAQLYRECIRLAGFLVGPDRQPTAVRRSALPRLVCVLTRLIEMGGMFGSACLAAPAASWGGRAPLPLEGGGEGGGSGGSVGEGW